MFRFAILVSILELFSISAYSQIATNSLFRETKSINPAVISKRPAAVFSIVAKVDKVDKTQDLSTSSFGANAKADTAVKVNSGDLFYGGRGDGGFTTELYANAAQGTKDNKLSTNFFSNDSSDKVNNQYAHLGLGLGRNFGVSMGFVKYNYQSTYSYSYSGTSYSSESKATSNVMLPKIGIAYNLGLDFGLYFQRMMGTSETQNNGVKGKDKQNLNFAGGGIGTSSKSFHTEIGYERDMTGQDVTNDGINYRKIHASRIMFALEFYLGKISLGYTGFYYQNGFMNLDNLLFNSLVYSNTWDKPRLENNFNFSLGSDKGHSFSGSLSFSTVKSSEKNSYSMGEEKYPTTTKAMGVSAKYAYIF